MSLLRSLRPWHVLAFPALLIQPVAVFANKGLAVLFVISAVGAVGMLLQDRLLLVHIPKTLATLIVAFLIWTGLSAFWSTAPDASLRQWAILIGVAVGGLALAAIGHSLSDAARGRVARVYLIGFGLGLFFLIEEMLTDGFLSGLYIRSPRFALNHGATILALGLGPVVLILQSWGRRKEAVALVALTAGALGWSDSLGAFLGLAVGTLVVVAVLYRPAPALKALIVILAVGIVSAPLIVRLMPDGRTLIERNVPESYLFGPRLYIWNNTVDRIVQKPLAGWGLNTSSTFSRHDEAEGVGYLIMEAIPLHPHNAVLQWWLELGLIGAALGGAIVVGLAAAIRRQIDDPWRAGLAAATLAAAVGIATLSYSIWQSWWMGACWLIGVFVVSFSRPSVSTA